MTAAEYTADAARMERDAAESFERCDTDGFLSQWASGINAQVARSNAEIAANDGQREFRRTVLQTLSGEPVNFRVVQTRYGTRYRVDATDEWLPYRPARESTLAKRGYREIEETVMAPAYASTWAPAGARGLSGCSSVIVRFFRADMSPSQMAREGWTT